MAATAMSEPKYSSEIVKEFGCAVADVLKSAKLSSALKTPFTRTLRTYVSSGATATAAVCNALLENPSAIQALLFGDGSIQYDAVSDTLVARMGQHSLQLAIRSQFDGPVAGIPEGQLVVQTDGTQFCVAKYRLPPQSPEIILSLSVQNLAHTIDFHGSLWAALHPSHHSIITQTISLTFPVLRKELLFARYFRADNADAAEKIAHAHLRCFQTMGSVVMTLDQFCAAQSSLPKRPTLQSTHSDGDYIFRKYSTCRSPLFDFGTPEEPIARDDFVTTYLAKDVEYHREFVVAPTLWPEGSEELRLAAFDVLNMLAIRRTKLFRAAFARRVYNVLFPPLYITDAADGTTRYALFPCLNMYRDVDSSFRRTASLSFLVLPVMAQPESPGVKSRAIFLDELYAIKDALAKNVFDTAAGARQYKTWDSIPGYYGALPNQAQLGQIIHKVAESIAAKAYRPTQRRRSENNAIARMMLAARLEARLTTALILVDWRPPEGYSQPWERWLTGTDDQVFTDALFRTMFYKDYLSPATAYASRHVAQFRNLNVGNTLGADMTGMTLFNPQDNLKLCIYPLRFESYPNYSIIRWAAWQIYIDSALSSLRALIHKFEPLMHKSSDLHGIIDTLKTMIHEFVEFYDLDIREYIYRKEYEKLRSQMQVDDDYKQLLSKFSSAKEDELLREQRLINKLVVSLTIATVTVTVVSTLAQMGQLNTIQYIAMSVASASVFVWIGYILFDPLKRAQSRLTKFLAYFRRDR